MAEFAVHSKKLILALVGVVLLSGALTWGFFVVRPDFLFSGSSQVAGVALKSSLSPRVETARKMLLLKEKLPESGFQVNRVVSSTEIGLVVYLEKGPKLYFSRFHPISDQLSVLKSALRKDSSFRSRFQDAAYIDLRVPDRIYFK